MSGPLFLWEKVGPLRIRTFVRLSQLLECDVSAPLSIAAKSLSLD